MRLLVCPISFIERDDDGGVAQRERKSGQSQREVEGREKFTPGHRYEWSARGAKTGVPGHVNTEARRGMRGGGGKSGWASDENSSAYPNPPLFFRCT
jgi:hypothetical protein